MRITVGDTVDGMSTRRRVPWSLSKPASFAPSSFSKSAQLAAAPPLRGARRPLGVVQVEDRGLRHEVGGAEARRVRFVALDLGRPALVRLDDQAERVAAALEHRGVVRGDAGDDVLRHLRVRDDPLERPAAALGSGDREAWPPSRRGGRGARASSPRRSAACRRGPWGTPARRRSPPGGWDGGLACSSVAPPAVLGRIEVARAGRRAPSCCHSMFVICATGRMCRLSPCFSFTSRWHSRHQPMLSGFSMRTTSI